LSSISDTGLQKLLEFPVIAMAFVVSNKTLSSIGVPANKVLMVGP
jgi:hypothetical protein